MMGTGTTYNSMRLMVSKRTTPFIFVVCLAFAAFYSRSGTTNDVVVESRGGTKLDLLDGKVADTNPPNLRREDSATVEATGSVSKAAYGQQLSLDLSGASSQSLGDEKATRTATLEIVDLAGLKLQNIHSFKLKPQGSVNVVVSLEDGHIAVQTWPERGTAIFDLFVRGARIDLKDILLSVAEKYGGDLSKSTYSIKPRGDFNEDEDSGEEELDKKLKQQFYPMEIMGKHQFKKKVYEKQSPFQHVAIYDHVDVLDDGNDVTTVTRSLFLDGVMQSNVHDEERYHESLVTPAFVSSHKPPKKVLIVGGGEGGTLRETLKWSSVETSTMVDLDADVVKASRQFLPSYSNCTGFGTPSCFDDPRVKLFTEDFIGWFDKHIGNDICEKRAEKKDLLFDVVIIDLLDTEELPEGEPWAEHLYSDLFFKRIACAVNPLGVVVTNFGEGPEFNGGPLTERKSENDVKRELLFQKKIKQIQTMSKYFRHERVYDTYVAAFRAQWAFAIGMVPDVTDAAEASLQATDDDANHVINNFNGNAARTEIKLRRELKEKAYPLKFYDGAIQHGFQYPVSDWKGFYCANKENKLLCDIKKSLFTEDHEEEWFETKVEGDGKTSIVAKQNIKKGHATGLWNAAASLKLPTTDFNAFKKFIGEEGKMTSVKDFLNLNGRGGGQDATGDTTYISLFSLLRHANPACNNEPNFQHIYHEIPSTKEFLDVWHPLTARNYDQMNNVLIATRDISKGETITVDSSHWNGLGKGTKVAAHPRVKELCDTDLRP